MVAIDVGVTKPMPSDATERYKGLTLAKYSAHLAAMQAKCIKYNPLFHFHIAITEHANAEMKVNNEYKDDL